jgi:hypothetical protein
VLGFLGGLFGRGGSRRFYEHCGWCGRDILYGDTSFTVNLNTERFDGTAVNVLGSEVLLMLCAPCGRRLGAGTLRQVLRAQRPPDVASFNI